MIRALIGVVLLAGCQDRPSLSIAVDMPPDGSPAFPFAGDVIDSLSLSILSSDGSRDSITSGDPTGELSIADVPFGRNLVVELSGDLGGTQTAYGRSCPFDFDKDVGGPGEIHVYFSRVRRWGEGPSALVPGRVGGHAYNRASGELLIAGGAAGGPVERFDPRSGEFSQGGFVAESVARIGGVLARIGSDSAIIVGGTDGNDVPITQIETLPDLRDSLTNGPPLRLHAASALPDDRALVVGGEQLIDTAFTVVGTAREYFLDANGRVVPDANAIPSLANPRAGHTATELFEGTGVAILIAGGLDGAGLPVTATEVYRPLSQTFETLAATLDRNGHQALRLEGNLVLIVGGFLGDGTPSRELALFDPVRGDFTAAGQLPAAAGITGFAATALSDGRVMLTGGRDESGQIVAAAHLVDVDVNGTVVISETSFLAAPRTDHVAVELCDRSVMLVGGQTTGGGAPVTERYVPGLVSS